MRAVGIPFILLGYIITISTCETQDYNAAETNAFAIDSANAIDNDVEMYVKRGGFQQRANTYNGRMSSIKRLPKYNFGLGKRGVSKPYSFGLGKRTDDENYFDEKPKLTYDQLKMILPLISGRQLIDNDDFIPAEKRARPYSFGLGKRMFTADENVERRSPPLRYNFGLGR